MNKVLQYKFSIAYILAILLVTVLFKYYPALITITEGVQFSFWTLLVGTWFVLRDYSQREVGHYVFIPMIIGVIAGTIISPAMGLAQILAMGASELTDWAVYTFTKKPFHQRILISSLVSAPIDTVVFFSAFDYLEIIPGVSIFNWATVVLGALSKLVAAVVIYLHYTRKLKTSP